MKNILTFLLSVFPLIAYPYEILEGKIESSVIYPGTVHTFKVSLPEGYDANADNALYVGFDGILYNAPEVIDSLISAGDIPPTVGVYLQPGTIKVGDMTYYNRSNEFDAIDSRMASFIETELLPAARSLVSHSGETVNFSDNPDMHAISGASSGGIAAFVVAWNRPDLFRRVYTTCGTYVSMRGGDLLPALVRKTEPKPLRLVIHDGSHDAWNPLFGHWYEQNLLLASSLKFAGYDLMTVWDDGNHSIRNGAILFPEAMKYLWKGYPEGITPGRSENDMLSVLLDGAGEWQLSDGVTETSDLAATYPDGNFRVEWEPGSSWIYSEFKNEDGEPVNRRKAYLLHDTSFSNPDVAGLAFDNNGNLYAATADGIQVLDQNGRVRVILPSPAPGNISGFAFIGNNLYLCIDNKWYSRTINATAHNPENGKVDVKSQGPA